MKAESIEQIREHLARGGRVVSDEGESVWKVVEYLAVETCNGGMIVPSQFDEKDWNLLPLEEKEPVRQYFYRVNGCLAEDASSDACICWHDEGTGPLKDKPERVHDWREKPVDYGTQKGQEDEYIEVERVCHIPAPCEMRLNKRIRTRLLHGQWPEMSDLLAWWEATTGERIEHGKRCERCDGSGKSPDFRVQCGVCQGSGYEVRPTWMGDANG